MAFVVKGTVGYSSAGTVFEPGATETEAWDKAIDTWKGVPTANRPAFRWRTLEAMMRNGYVVVDLNALKTEWLAANKASQQMVGCSSKSKAFQKARRRLQEAEQALRDAGFKGGSVILDSTEEK